MYKRIIGEIVKQKEEERIQQANQNYIETTNHNSNMLLVGYISTIIIDKNKRLTKMTLNAPKLFMRIEGGRLLKDIETGEKYPLIPIGGVSVRDAKLDAKLDVKCVLERDLEPFTSTCLDAINEKGVKYGAFLTKNQAKEILNRQMELNTFGF